MLCSSLLNEDVINIKCGSNHTLVLKSNGDVLSCGHSMRENIDSINYSSFTRIEELSEIIRIECGSVHSMFIDINNDFYVFGSNRYGQLGLGTHINNTKEPVIHPLSTLKVIDISSGGFHSFVKTSNNEIYAFGASDHLQLGIKTGYFKLYTPIRVFENNEDIWCSNINSLKVKSARK